MTQPINSNRIEVVDALRGFAIMAIILLHNVEHFDLYSFPDSLPLSIKILDKHIWYSIFFLFSGKVYSIFSILFGFSFFIMYNNQLQNGYDFRWRFVWRLFILLGFGIINNILFEGDMLTFYAVLGISLVLVGRLNTRIVLVILIILLLQPLEWAKCIYLYAHPDLAPPHNISDLYFGKTLPALKGHSFWELAKENLWNGRVAVILWSSENGRFFQAPALFMIGLLLGRLSRFVFTPSSIRFWKRTLILSIIGVIPLFFIRQSLGSIVHLTSLRPSIFIVMHTLYNTLFTFAIIASFVLLYRTSFANRILKPLSVFGKMSLTNCIIQSILGISIYYGFGLSMYKFAGASYSLLIGVVLIILQFSFCKWWLKHHQQGPLEYLWHKATWLGR